MFNGLTVPHNIQAMGAGALAALAALCYYLKRAKADDELATYAQKVSINDPRRISSLRSIVPEKLSTM